ncbi:MAG: SH3 domain-containing protein [Anaerolineae bacterium]
MQRKVLWLFLLCLGAVLPLQAQETGIFESDWRAEYFNNPYLAGTPNVTRFDNGIGFDWGLDAPVAGIPADNFSVRWGKGGQMPSGTYRFIVTASLGFRLYIDNEVILDTWDGGADGVTIGRDIFIEGGYHNIQVDYRAFSGNAFIFLDWGLAPDGEIGPQPTNLISSNTVVVTANTLNVRNEPRIANNIMTRIARGQQFLQVSTSADGRWVQLDLGNGTRGWVSASYVTASFATVDDLGLSGQRLRSSARLLIRTAPSTDAEALDLLLRGEDALIIGRSSDGNWWQIRQNGRVGWVNALFVILSPDVDPDGIAITN